MRWLLLIFLFVGNAYAACSSCTTSSASCTAGSTAAQIIACIDAVPDQATITLDAGTYTATAITIGDSSPDGITIACASVGGCTMSGAQPFRYTTSNQKTNLIRITGMVFTNTTGPGIDIGYTSGFPWIAKLRIDHNEFQGADAILIGSTETGNSNPVYGVIDNNTFSTANPNYPIGILGAGETDWSPALLGTGNALFIEDNTFNNTNEAVGGSGMDIWHGGRMVVRYNTITNARTSTHGVCHNGPALLEVYNNTYTSSGGTSRIVHHQGSGEMIVWGNSFADSGEEIALQHYRSFLGHDFTNNCSAKPYICDGTGASDGNRSPDATYEGYPCWRQPGRDSAATLRPIYIWNNWLRSDNSNATFAIEGDGGSTYLAQHLVSVRDYYRATSASAQSSASSPFSGAASSNGGMGFGTLANRPTTCETNADANDASGCSGSGCGVGYWATDGGTNWNKSNTGTTDGGLYICSATDTWELYYTPYTYPHPLRNETDQTSGGENLALFLAQWAIVTIGIGILGAIYARRNNRTGNGPWNRHRPATRTATGV